MNEGTTFKRPWGFYSDYFRDKNTVFKTLCILPGHKISYQTHANRDETWYIKSGKALFKYSSSNEPLKNFSIEEIFEGQLLTIERGMAHQVINIGTDNLIIQEMQSGTCDEHDIVRLEDDYAEIRDEYDR